MSKIDADVKKKNWLKKENLLIDLEIQESVRIENSKQYALKWVETGVNIYKRIVRNRLKKMALKWTK